jgi:FixJ family two-component response regulator
MITDVVMPQMSGYELAERFAPLRPEMSVVYISGYDEEMVTDHGSVEPDRQFLQKPFLPTEVAKKIREILDKPVATHKSVGQIPATSDDNITPV